MDFQYILIFFLSFIIMSILVYLICKMYFENKNKNNITNNHEKEEINQILELKGALFQLSKTMEERLGNFGSSIGNSLSQQTESI